MKSIILSLLVVCTAFTGLKAQQAGANIVFEKKVHDFGTFKEEDGNVSYNFNFSNTGSVPLIVSNVRPSCGCTSPSWTKDPVPPGGTGHIKATYNPSGRPGKFNKTISVYTNSANKVVVLTIKGEVIPKKMELPDIYKQSMGPLRLKSKSLSFSQAYLGNSYTKTIDIWNNSNHDMVLAYQSVPSHITVKTEPEVLKPMQEGKMVITFDAGKVNDYGIRRDRVNVVVNEQKNSGNIIYISSNLQEDFSQWTPQQKADAPHINFESTEYNFGEVQQGEKVEVEFTFSNSGKSPLVLRKVKAACGCTAIKPSKPSIDPGETSSIKATFNSNGRKGKQRKTITVISNDPDKPSVILRLVGNVVV